MTEEEEARDAIVDLAVTTGKAKDRTSDIHTPPARQESRRNKQYRQKSNLCYIACDSP